MSTADCELGEADRLAQHISHLADDTVEAVRALLLRPDSVSMRLAVRGLVERLAYEISDASDRINSSAEAFNTNFDDERRGAAHVAIIAAVQQGSAA